MKNKLGTCALCKESNVRLRDSHIIPRLAYKRAKSFENSRFRSLENINVIYQDGEKKPMLCQRCETLFSGFETAFTNKFLDKYLETGNLPDAYEKMDNYILSVAWRILYDDIYNLNSYQGKNVLKYYKDFESILFEFLNDIRCGNEPESPIKIKNYIFRLEDFGYKEELIDYLKSSLFGYSFNEDLSSFIAYTHYNGLIIATVFRPNEISLELEGEIKLTIYNELNYEIRNMIEKDKNNKKILDAGLREKISKRYNK